MYIFNTIYIELPTRPKGEQIIRVSKSRRDSIRREKPSTQRSITKNRTEVSYWNRKNVTTEPAGRAEPGRAPGDAAAARANPVSPDPTYMKTIREP
ncbi:hypothetical protein EVAR_93261_1 [Eumeta japonica]|uniref:Uncharacterized protein n=1 Tax=Eumeta variegata TaxID=151549 RepID=A0A4C1TXP1_EUMVA|nr:hypothetical protein EVAR_93261_1 [Eumeta japonica]